MKRFIEEKIFKWITLAYKALLIEGARQVGKTYIIRKVLKENNINYFEINFIERPDILKEIKDIDDIDILINKFNLFSNFKLKKGDVIFLDEIQEYAEIVTKIKFLVENNTYRFVLSGSLLGLTLNNIKSVPVGYIESYKMYPMNFFEFLIASDVSIDTINYLKECFINKKEVDNVIHEKIMNLYKNYLVVGGMPSIINIYLKTKNLDYVKNEQKNIVNEYKRDFSKYENIDRRLRIISIYENIPLQLNKNNYKFIFSYLDKQLKFNRYENSFLWLVDAGVTLPTYNVRSLDSPLIISKNMSSFKLFNSDVGLLLSNFPDYIRNKLFIEENANFNEGMLYENFACQELFTNGFKTYYYLNKKMGEVDFLINTNINVNVIEIKSGKDFKIHRSLDKIIDKYPNYNYFVFTNYNIVNINNITYYPIYMIGFIEA